MAVDAGTLEIKMLMGLARLQQDVTQATSIVGRGMADIQSAVAKTKGALEALGVSLGVGALALFAESIINATARFKELGQEAGVTASAISKFEEPARKAGSSTDFVASAMFRMTKAIVEAQDPQSKAAKALNAIGLSAEQLKGLKPDEIFELIARASANFGDGVGKNAVMMELFNKSGREMNKVAAEIAATEKLTATTTDEQAEAAHRLHEQMVELKINSEKFWRSLVSEGVPALNDIVKAFIDARREGNLFDGLVAGMSAAFDRLFGKTLQLQILETDKAIEDQIKLMKNLKENADLFGMTPSFKVIQEQTRVLNELLQKQLGLRQQLAGNVFAGGSASGEKPEIKLPDSHAAARIGELSKEFEELRAKILGAAQGLDSNFLKELALLDIAFVHGKIAFGEYAALYTALIKQQPFYKKGLEDELKAQEDLLKIDEKIREEIAALDKKRTDAILGAEKTIADIEFETKALRMSDTERQIAIALRALETSGINKQDAAYQSLADRIRAAIEQQQGVRAEIEASTEAERNSQGAWEDFADRVIHGFKDMRAALKSFVQDLIAMFAKRWILQIGAALTGSTALGATASQVGAGSVGGSLLGAGGSLIGSAGNAIFGGSSFGAALGSSIGASASTLGIAYEAGSAAVGGLGAVAGAALNLVPVIGLAVTAIYALYQAFKDTGENWRATLGFGANAQAYTNTGPFGAEGFQSIQGNDALNRQIQAFFASTGAVDTIIASTLSSDTVARITANLGGAYTTRNDGQPAQFAFSADDTTAMAQLTLEYLQKKYGTIFDEIDHKFADFIRSYTGDSAGLLQAIGEFAAVLNALQDSPVPGLDLESLRAMQREGEKLSDTFNSVAQGFSSFVDTFYTDEEKQSRLHDMLERQFADLDQTLPTTRDAFRQMVEAAGAGGAATADLYRRLLELAPAVAQLIPVIDAVGGAANALARGPLGILGRNPLDFGNTPDFENSPIYRRDAENMKKIAAEEEAARAAAELARAMAEAKDSLRKWLDSLIVGDLSPLSPMEKLSASKAAFEKDLALAKGGNADAAGRIQGDADTYLRLAREIYASSSTYGDIFKRVFDQVSGFAGAPDYNTRMLTAQETQISHLSNIRDALLAIRDDQRLATSYITDAVNGGADRIAAAVSSDPAAR